MQSNETAIQILGSVQSAAALVFALNGIVLLYIRKKLGLNRLGMNIGLSFAGAAYALLISSGQFDVTVDQIRTIQHLSWISGCIFIFFYISAIEQFIQTNAKYIQIARKALVGITVISLGATIYYWITGNMILYSEGPLPLDTIFIADIVKSSLNVNALTGILGLLFFVLTLPSFFIFLSHMRKQNQDSILIMMTLFGCLIMLYEIVIAIAPFKYGLSLLFVSGLLESFRLGILAVKQNMQEQNLAKQTAIETHFIVKSLGLGLYRWDLISNELTWDTSMYELYDIPPDKRSSPRDAWRLRVLPEDQARTMEELKDAFSDQKPYDSYFRIVLENGKTRGIGARGFVDRDESGKAIRVTGVNWDATELLSERLKNVELQGKLEAITSNTPGLFCQMTLTQNDMLRMPYVVFEGLKLFDISKDEYLADNEILIKQIHPEDIATLRAAVKESMRTLQRLDFTGRVLGKAGKIIWINFISMPQPLERDGVLWNGVFTNVTKQVELESQINIERSMAVQNSKLASLGEMSAGIAHEINNPLAIIASGVTNLPKFVNDPEKFALRIAMISRSVDRIAKIVSGLRKFSRSSQLEDMAVRNLSDIVTESLTLTRNNAARHSSKVSFNRLSEGPILCKEIEIEQVIVNVVNNAIDAVKTIEDRWIKIEVTEARDEFGETVVLTIADAGTGMPKEVREKLFHPFFTTKPIGEGTGLGLSISKGILDQHGASIALNTNLPYTCFEIRFPKWMGA